MKHKALAFVFPNGTTHLYTPREFPDVTLPPGVVVYKLLTHVPDIKQVTGIDATFNVPTLDVIIDGSNEEIHNTHRLSGGFRGLANISLIEVDGSEPSLTFEYLAIGVADSMSSRGNQVSLAVR